MSEDGDLRTAARDELCVSTRDAQLKVAPPAAAQSETPVSPKIPFETLRYKSRENRLCGRGVGNQATTRAAIAQSASYIRHLNHGGEGGIRTPGTLARTPHFECGAIDHSATSPADASARSRLSAWGRAPISMARPGSQGASRARLARRARASAGGPSAPPTADRARRRRPPGAPLRRPSAAPAWRARRTR